jgi:hypothetical protein
MGDVEEDPASPLPVPPKPLPTLLCYRKDVLSSSISISISIMAWRCSGKTNGELISNLRREGLISSGRVAEAMKQVDRAKYCPDKRGAYQDSPQPIGYSATISAPHSQYVTSFVHGETECADW